MRGSFRYSVVVKQLPRGSAVIIHDGFFLVQILSGFLGTSLQVYQFSALFWGDCLVFVTIWLRLRAEIVWLSEMASSKNNIAAKPSDAISRREVGKVAWRNMLDQLIDSEKEDLEDLKALRRRLSDAECLRLVSGLLERKVERIIELNGLLHYRDKDSATTSKPAVKEEPLYPFSKE